MVSSNLFFGDGVTREEAGQIAQGVLDLAADTQFRWHVLSECPDEGPCPIHGRPEPQREVEEWSADDEITCPSCEECGLFSLRPGGAGVLARCQGCHHEWIVVHPSGGVIWGPEI